MKRIKILIGIALMLYFVDSNAQNKDFLVLITKDTIYGNANSAKRKGDKMQINVDGHKRIYDFNRVSSYYTFWLDTYFEKINITNSNKSYVFAERINVKKGRINIYRYEVSYSDGYFSLKGYISKDDEKPKGIPIGVYRIAKKKTMKMLLPYFQDNPDITAEIGAKGLKDEEFKNLIKRYNDSFETNNSLTN